MCREAAHQTVEGGDQRAPFTRAGGAAGAQIGDAACQLGERRQDPADQPPAQQQGDADEENDEQRVIRDVGSDLGCLVARREIQHDDVVGSRSRDAASSRRAES